MARPRSCSNKWLWNWRWFWSAGCHSLSVWQYHHWFTLLTRSTKLSSYNLHLQAMLRAQIFCRLSSDLTRLLMWCDFGLFHVEWLWLNPNRVVARGCPRFFRSKLGLALLQFRQTNDRSRCVQFRSCSRWLYNLVLDNRHAVESELLGYRILRSFRWVLHPAFARLLCIWFHWANIPFSSRIISLNEYSNLSFLWQR